MKKIKKFLNIIVLIIVLLLTFSSCKENVDDTVLTKLKNNLADSEKQALLTEAKAATSWIYEYIKLICRS